MSSLTVQAPEGASFNIEEVATKGGTEKFEAPILVWNDTAALTAHLGTQGVLDMADGTSLRVAYQAAARRGHVKNLTSDQIAQMQIDYKPGKRSGVGATPANKTARIAKEVIDQSPEAADEIQKFLQAFKDKKFSLEDLKSMNA